MKETDQTACTPEVLLFCAVSPQLSVNKVLLSAEDYAALEQSTNCLIVLQTDPSDKIIIQSQVFEPTNCALEVESELSVSVSRLFDFEQSEPSTCAC